MMEFVVSPVYAMQYNYVYNSYYFKIQFIDLYDTKPMFSETNYSMN